MKNTLWLWISWFEVFSLWPFAGAWSGLRWTRCFFLSLALFFSVESALHLHCICSPSKALVLANSVTSDTVGVVLFAIRVAARRDLGPTVSLWAVPSCMAVCSNYKQEELMALQVCVCGCEKNNNFTVEHICILQQLQRSSFLLRCWVCNVFAAASPQWWHQGGVFIFLNINLPLRLRKLI